MITEQFEIVEAFSKGINVELTINQISKIIKKSYAFTNKYTHDLIEKGILNKKAVGSAILCSLNFHNEETLGSLVFASIRKKTEFEKSSKEDTKSYHKSFDKFCIDDTEIVFYQDKKLHIITKSEKLLKTSEKSLVIRTPESFRSDLRKIDFSNLIILQGYEGFWRLVSKAVI